MDFIIVLKLVAILGCLHTSQVVSQVRLTGNFDSQQSIIEGTVVTLNCSVKDRNNGLGATIISGSQAIFDCPNEDNTNENRMLTLQHLDKQFATAVCEPYVSSQIVEVVNGTYITQITIITTTAMSKESVECRKLGMNDSQQIQLPNIIGMNTTLILLTMLQI